ncbi:Ferric iron ABC transporter, ATP-binding protein [hydrothermal vent metagenome]|uniref:Ferric iron ABC transporter, ATP-binding protein n=1 Tax=hydrothermal vent metagenome TaxID=652676 RepID=A0A3B0TZ66_9ZZZZ
MRPDLSPQSPPKTVPRVVFEQITRTFGEVAAVCGVDLELAPRELLCLLGHSGCGKTTLMRIAAGLERQSSGRILINGRDVASPERFEPPEMRGVGFMFQDYALFPHLTILENVAFGLQSHGRGAALQIAGDALAQVGLARLAQVYPHTLSGGEQQRAALARAIAPRPAVVFMDEPFSGLDRGLRESVRDQTLAILAETGASCILVTHDPEEAMMMADRIALMRKGRLVQVGAPNALYFSPADAQVARFFSDMNVFEGQVAGGRVETPVGPVDAGGLGEGEAVQVLVREHGLEIGNEAGIPAQVIAIRFAGEVTRADLVVFGHEHKVRVRLAGDIHLNSGDNVRLAINPSLAFVFPQEILQ